MNLTRLRHLVSKHFDKEELRTLAFDLEVDYDDLPGEGKANKARELVTYLQRRNNLPRLVKLVRELRPNVAWEDVATTVESEPATTAGEVGTKALPAIGTLNDIREKLQQRRLALFIGADLPEAITGLPNRQTLADTLAIRHGIVPGQSLAAVAQQVMSAGNRFLFTDFLRQTLDTTGKRPQPLHKAIVTLAQHYFIETLMTTAYDDLLETAFQQAGGSLNRVVTDADLAFTRPDASTFIKLYGDWRQVTSLSVTEQDINALLRGREKEKMLNEARRAFGRNSLLFLGQDVNDPALKSLLDEIAGGRFQLPAYAVWTGLSQPEIASFKSNRGLTILPADPLAVVQALQP